MREITFIQAVAEAQREEMEHDPTVILLGEDVRLNMFGTAPNFVKDFGESRVIDTPISESGFMGVGVGSAMAGLRPIVEISIASFLYVAMDQIVSMASKATYMYGGQAKVPMMIRTNMMFDQNNASQHSDRPYPLFMNTPGLKIIAPSTAYDMKGLLKTAIRDDDPVMSFEDVGCWMTKSQIPDEEYFLPLGKADVKLEGDDVTVVALGRYMWMAQEAAKELEKDGISVEVVDPRTLVPLDKALILESVKKTGHLVVVDSSHKTCGAGAEISAIVAEEGFSDLKGPIMRVATDDVPPPFSPALEPQIYPTKEKIIAAVHQTLGK